jgi:hypothetical protein
MAEASVALKPLWVRPRGAARLLDCGLTRVYELIAADEIVSVLDGHSRRILVSSIEAYIGRMIDAQAGQKVREERTTKLPNVRKSSRAFGGDPRPPRPPPPSKKARRKAREQAAAPPCPQGTAASPPPRPPKVTSQAEHLHHSTDGGPRRG